MTPRKKLLYLKTTGCRKIRKLEKKTVYALTLPASEREALISYVVIESLNTWSNFLRALYLSFTIESKSTKGKKVIVIPAISNFNDAIGKAINCNRRNPLAPPFSGEWGRRDEPKWYDLNIFVRSCNEINCSYMPDINVALSIGTRAYVDLPIIRNYYAHRNNSTSLKVKNLASSYGISQLLSPTEILCAYPIMAFRPLILDILDDLYISMELLCEGL